MLVLATLLTTVHLATAQTTSAPPTSAMGKICVITKSGHALFSTAGMTRVRKKAIVVFNSFKLPGNGRDKSYGALYIPGLRVQTASNQAIQFGVAGINSQGHFAPIPMVQWYSRF